MNKSITATVVGFIACFGLFTSISVQAGVAASADLSITKDDGVTAVTPGGSLSYTITVTNAGPDDVTGATVADTFPADLSGCTWSCVADAGNACTAAGAGNISDTADLLANSSVVYSATCTVAASPAGAISNTATVSSAITDPVPANNSATHVTEIAVITLSKTAAPTSVPEPGGNVSFTLLVNNTGTIAVTLASLNDDIYGDLNGQGSCSVPQTIAASSSYSCSFSGLVNGNAGVTQTDTVIASGNGGGAAVTAMDDAIVTITDVLPTISVSKTANPTSVDEPGGNVSFSVQVDNTGSAEAVTLTGLNDDIYGDLNGQGDCSVPQTIVAGGNYSCSFTVLVSGNGGDSEINTITATAEDDEANSTNGQGMATVTITDILPTIGVSKTANPTSVDEPGGNVSFSVQVDNTGSAEAVTLTGLNDDIYGDLNGQGDCSAPQTIAAGGNYSCSFTVLVSGNGGDSEINTITATAEDDEANSTTGQDMATVTITDILPTVSVILTAAPMNPEPGENVSFSVQVNNTGSAEAISLTSLMDDIYGDLNGQGDCTVPQSIAAGDMYTCSFTVPVDGVVGSSQTNTVTATVEDDDGNSITGQAAVTVTLSPDPTAIPSLNQWGLLFFIVLLGLLVWQRQGWLSGRRQ